MNWLRVQVRESMMADWCLGLRAISQRVKYRTYSMTKEMTYEPRSVMASGLHRRPAAVSDFESEPFTGADVKKTHKALFPR
jgi:hypothetical protein